MTRVLVCGGRTYGELNRLIDPHTMAWYTDSKGVARERQLLKETLHALSPRPRILIHGAAKGADRLARAWAVQSGIPEMPFPANWYPNGFGKLDRSAGPKRNQRMIDEGKPDLVIAFPGGSGTADMIRRARAAGIEVREIKG